MLPRLRRRIYREDKTIGCQEFMLDCASLQNWLGLGIGTRGWIVEVRTEGFGLGLEDSNLGGE